MPELTWPGKRSFAPEPAALIPEAIIYPQGNGYASASAPSSRLILGDNLAIMSALLPEYAGRINLIYADPPFFTNRKYSVRIGRGEDSRKPDQWQLAEGYADHWRDLDAYLDFLHQRLTLMHHLLAPNGTIYLHLDWHADAYARLLLDEIFGADNVLNEIIWTYHGPSPIRRAFNRKHDTILVYVKGANFTFNADAVREPYNPSTVKTFAASPKAGFGKVPNLARGKVPEDWWYFPVVARLHNERTGYPTQKPEALLERIILASSNPGDLVADFFCGSGTTPLVAARHGRRFLASDLTARAVQTTARRLVSAGSNPFSFEHAVDFPLSTSSSRAAVTLEGKTITLPPSLVSKLDYWEIDPHYNGKVFKSAFQAVRARKSEKIESQIILPKKSNGPICVRMITAKGERYQVELQSIAKNAKPKF
jgi:DNA modification methylase